MAGKEKRTPKFMGTESIRNCAHSMAHLGAVSALLCYGLYTNSTVVRDGEDAVVTLVREDGVPLGAWRGSIPELLDLLDYLAAQDK
jgi:hypothetical protein